MKELRELQKLIEKKLDTIRRKENKTLNDREEYKKLQEQLKQVYNVEIWIGEMNK